MSLSSAIPVFKLYGENLNWPTPELLHCESIHSRSSLYEWHIRVHQHADLVQLLYLHKGKVEIDIEGEKRLVTRPCIQVVPALCVHAFKFLPGTQGYSLSLSAPLIAQFERQFGRSLEVLNQATCVPVKASRGQINTLFRALQSEYASQAQLRDMMIHSLSSALLVWLTRQRAPVQIGSEKVERKRAAIRYFNQLIEQHYREHLSVAAYAGMIGLSSAHLNTLCHEYYAQSALNVINQRLLLEAKRCLLYTPATISQVSDYLGFSDATYFSRFFRRYTQTTPKAFRAEPSEQIAHY